MVKHLMSEMERSLKKEFSHEILSSFLYYLGNKKNLKVADIGGSLEVCIFNIRIFLKKKLINSHGKFMNKKIL